MEVIFAQTAIDDLQRIGEHFLRIEPETAPQRVVAIRRACEDLADFPRKGRLLPGYGLRRLVFGPFLIFYRIRRNQVGIATILHGSQDWRSILRDLS